MKVDGKLEGVVVVGVRSDSMGVVIEVKWESSIWLTMGGVTD